MSPMAHGSCSPPHRAGYRIVALTNTDRPPAWREIWLPLRSLARRRRSARSGTERTYSEPRRAAMADKISVEVNCKVSDLYDPGLKKDLVDAMTDASTRAIDGQSGG